LQCLDFFFTIIFFTQQDEEDSTTINIYYNIYDIYLVTTLERSTVLSLLQSTYTSKCAIANGSVLRFG
jgi:hypothetical protein